MRMWLLPVLAGVLGACSQAPEPASPSTAESDLFAGESLYRDVVTYAGFGIHQTASVGDLNTSKWIADSLRATGNDVTVQEWPLRQFAPTACELTVDGEAVPAFPFWYPKQTGPEGVSGTLQTLLPSAPEGVLAGEIAFVDGGTHGQYIWTTGVNAIAEHAARAGALGLVVVVRTHPGLLAGINARAPYHQEPLPIPAVIAPLSAEARLRSETGTPTTLVLTGNDVEDAVAQNVVMTIERGPKWIVVTTPTSGWFQCAGERGPGVALFLALARWASALEDGPSWLFMANSGHELDNLGAHVTLDAFAPPPEDVTCWIHLGASIATRKWESDGAGGFHVTDAVGEGGHIVATEDVLALTTMAFEGVPGPTPRSGEPILGELRHFVDAGYTAFGFFGGHHYFHTPKDTPETTSPELLEGVGRALERAVSKLAAP